MSTPVCDFAHLHGDSCRVERLVIEEDCGGQLRAAVRFQIHRRHVVLIEPGNVLFCLYTIHTHNYICKYTSVYVNECVFNNKIKAKPIVIRSYM